MTCLSDILPTGYHGAVTAGVGPGSTVYIAGAGPVGLAAAASACAEDILVVTITAFPMVKPLYRAQFTQTHRAWGQAF